MGRVLCNVLVIFAVYYVIRSLILVINVPRVTSQKSQGYCKLKNLLFVEVSHILDSNPRML